MEPIEQLANDLAALARSSAWLAEPPNRAERDEGWRVVVQFIDDFERANRPQRRLALAGEPSSTGSACWDAFVAALAEYLSRRFGAEPPSWVFSANRVLEHWWFPSGYESLYATALVESPAPFAVRGIFLTAGALARL